MQRNVSYIWMFFFLVLANLPALGALKSLYVFGDGLSTATVNQPLVTYYGDRWSNGRTWVEVLAQNLGLSFNLAGNVNSYFGNTSDDLVGEVKNYVPPSDATNVLVVIWVNNADLYNPATANPPTLDGFNAVITRAQTNHYNAITNLYAKGIRNLVMPNVVDISTIPAFNNNPDYTNLLHQASTNYNAAFSATLNRVLTNANYQDLKIYTPDFFSLLTNLLTHPATYGVTNALQGTRSIDALAALGSNTSISNGPGTNYIFWDAHDPTAYVHSIMANVTQQLISPAQIGKITTFIGSNRLDLVNVPVYTNVPMNGLVLSRTNLSSGNWITNLIFSTTNVTQSVSVTNSGPQMFYRLKFPYVWAWP